MEINNTKNANEDVKSPQIDIKRLQEEFIVKNLEKKMVFLVGPRQVGKTYLAKKIGKLFKRTLYLNYDSIEGKRSINNQDWSPDTELIIFDELHKMKNWKNYLKGLYDTKPEGLRILVTGSARLDTFRKSGDSLAGRFFVHHLMPLSIRELVGIHDEHPLDSLINRGGFPEALLAKEDMDAQFWRKTYIDSLIREDVLDFQKVDDMSAIKNVFEILRRSVGSPISYKSISEDIGISPITVKKYIKILEALHIVFIIRTYTKKIKRSILKETKVYFYDTGMVLGDIGVVVENAVALELVSHALLKNDHKGTSYELMYLRTKEGNEADFAFVDTWNDKLESIFEVKTSDTTLSKNLEYFSSRYHVPGIQLVRSMNNPVYQPTELIKIVRAEDYLRDLK